MFIYLYYGSNYGSSMFATLALPAKIMMGG